MASVSTALPVQQPAVAEKDPQTEEVAVAAADVKSIVTVFDDPSAFTVKHPLMNSWTMWFTKPPSKNVCSHGHIDIDLVFAVYDVNLCGIIGERVVARSAQGGHYLQFC